MLERVVSGGQTGADQGGWRAARTAGIPTGSWMPRGFLTEAGPRSGFAGQHGAREMTTADYPPRTHANARDSDATIWFGDPGTPGGKTTLRACADLGRPVYLVIDGLTRPSDVAAWIETEEVRVLNVAGNRESSGPGIGAKVDAFLIAAFRHLTP